MFGKISNSWALVKASWAVLRADKELIVFPIVSFVGVVAVTVVFFVPSLLVGAVGSKNGVTAGGYIILFLYYIVMYTVIFFSNTALVGAALKRLDGGNPTLSDGFNIAFSRLGKIIGYAVIASTVGIVLQWLRERGWLGRLVAGMMGLAWNVATFLVVPVLVVEDLGPIEAVQRSTALLKKTWGEQIVGNFGIGAVFGLIVFLVIVVSVPVLVVAASVGVLLFGVLLAADVMLVMGIFLIQSTLSGIYVAAVYRYATTGEVHESFRPELIQGAFRLK